MNTNRPSANSEIQVGSLVYTGVHIGREWHRMVKGKVVGIHSGYYDVDVMSLHGGAPWITSHAHVELINLQTLGN